MGKDLKTMECFFFSLKPPITVNETSKIWSKQILKANNTGDRLCGYELFCNSGNVYERFTRNRYRLTNQSNIYIQITYITYANLWIRINWDSHRFQLDYDEIKSGWFSSESVFFLAGMCLSDLIIVSGKQPL